MTQPHLQANASVVAVYADSQQAERAIRSLHAAGVEADRVSLVKRHIDPEGQVAADLKINDDSLRDAAIGGALGGLAGAVGAATLISVTGIGLILLTGPLVTLTGSIVGAFLGAMRGWGIHDARIRDYEKLVAEGKVLVVVAGETAELEHAERLLAGTGADSVQLHAKSSDDSPEIDDRPGKHHAEEVR